MHGIVTTFRLLTQYFNMLNLIGKGNIAFDQNSHKSTQMNYYSYNAYVTPLLCWRRQILNHLNYTIDAIKLFTRADTIYIP